LATGESAVVLLPAHVSGDKNISHLNQKSRDECGFFDLWDQVLVASVRFIRGIELGKDCVFHNDAQGLTKLSSWMKELVTKPLRRLRAFNSFITGDAELAPHLNARPLPSNPPVLAAGSGQSMPGASCNGTSVGAFRARRHQPADGSQA
jgi:hypothetical protein